MSTLYKRINRRLICNNKATDIKVLSEDVISGEKVYVLEGNE